MRREHSIQQKSESGKYILAIVRNGNYYTSNDYGQTFIERVDVISSKEFCCMSYSGQYQYFTGGHNQGDSQVYVSSDYGQTFSNKGYTKNYYGIVCSGDGQYVLIGTMDDYVYFSSNYGQTFTQISSSKLPRGYWGNPAISEDGQHMIIAKDYSNYAYVSNDYGVNWVTKITDIGNRTLLCKMSSDGQYMYVRNLNNGLYRSIDYGATFSKLNSVPSNVTLIDCDYTGQKLCYCLSSTGNYYYSNNYGDSWDLLMNSTTCSGICINEDGNRVYISKLGDKLYSASFGSSIFTPITTGNRNWVGICTN